MRLDGRRGIAQMNGRLDGQPDGRRPAETAERLIGLFYMDRICCQWLVAQQLLGANWCKFLGYILVFIGVLGVFFGFYIYFSIVSCPGHACIHALIFGFLFLFSLFSLFISCLFLFTRFSYFLTPPIFPLFLLFFSTHDE